MGDKVFDGKEALKEFGFKESSERIAWAIEVETAWQLLVEEIEPFLAVEYHEDAHIIRERLGKISEFLGRLAYRRARLNSFYKVAVSQKKIHYSGCIGAKVNTVNEKAKRDAAGIEYLRDLAEYDWDSLKEMKEIYQSLLAMARAEGLPVSYQGAGDQKFLRPQGRKG